MTRRRILRAIAGLASALALPGLWKRRPQVQYDATGKPIVNSRGEPFLEPVPEDTHWLTQLDANGKPMVYSVNDPDGKFPPFKLPRGCRWRAKFVQAGSDYDPGSQYICVGYTFEITNGK